MPRLLAVFGIATLIVILNIPASHALDPLIERGTILFKKCQACHQVGLNAKHRVGPLLNDIFGRRAGTLDGYRYSGAISDAGQNGLVWSEERLSAFIAAPKQAVPGTKMNFIGLPDVEDRAALVAFIRQFSPGAGNIPEAPPTVPVIGAAPPVPPGLLALKGDADYGQYLASECVTCHQQSGADKGIPSITGWPTADFIRALHAYKIKTRENPVMQLIASSLADEEIAALAAYFTAVD